MTDTDRQRQEDELDRRIWRAVFIGGTIVAVIVCALGWRFVAPRLDAAKQLDHSVVVVNQADTELAALGSAVAAEAASPSTATEAALIGLQPGLADTRTRLAEVVAGIDAGMPRLSDDEQREAVLVRAGAQARLDEIDAVPGIVSASRRAANEPSAANTEALRKLAIGPSGAYQSARARAAEADTALKGL